MAKNYFITGTDTAIGKTYITAGLLNAFNQQGYSTIALKPLASGGIVSPQGLRNQDALVLQDKASVKLPYELVNPITLAMPIAPHIAAAKTGLLLSAEMIINQCKPALLQSADVVLMEGIGGWYVPLNATQTMADVAKELNFEVIFVVGMRLGCLNHALLTYRALVSDNVPLKGWIANCVVADMPCLEENIQTLTERIAAPLLGTVPFGGLVEQCVALNLLV